jgi:hypothetical protein
VKFIVLFFSLVIFVSYGFSQDATKKRDNPRYKENLERWNKLTPEQKQEMRKRYEKLRSMNDDERRQFQERAERFNNLTPEQKEILRKKMEIYRNLPEGQKSSIERFIKRFQNMPPFRKQMLQRRIQKLRSMSPERRERILEQKRFWNEMTEEQREGLRKFLFSEDSPLQDTPDDRELNEEKNP